METLKLVYYSPTGTTQKIVREIGLNTGLKLISESNIAKNKIESMPKINNDCLTIIGVPVYAGRLAITAIEELKKLKSNKSPVVIVVVYGNREYDDALLELREIASSCGFKIAAAAAFIGEHSFSSKEKPIADNRPDKQDLEKCNYFASMITEKLKIFNDFNDASELDIPGSYPYKERNPLPTELHPETDDNLCHNCETCVDICPTNAITINTGKVITDGEICTWCCACIKSCPSGARIFDNPRIDAIKEKLFINCSERKEPVFFI